MSALPVSHVSSAPPLSLRDRQMRRWSAMKTERSAYDGHILDISEHFRPRRTRFTQADKTAKAQRYTKIIDNTGVTSANVLRAGLVNGLSSPTQSWYRYEPEDLDLLEYGPAKAWLGMKERLVQRILQASNFYESITNLYDEVQLFATACAIIDDDFEDVVRFNTFTFGEYCLAANERRVVDTMYRELSMTVANIVAQFGLKNASPFVRNAWDNGNYDHVAPVMHAIEPNIGRDADNPSREHMPWRSTYWEPTARHDQFLRKSGYKQNPIIAPRWHVIGMDVYGSSCPGMEALGDVRQLQIQQKRKGTAIEKQVNPPMQRPASFADRFISTLPGADNVVPDASQQGARPLYEVKPELTAFVADIEDTRERVRNAFFVRHILAISMMEGVQPKNQMELMERKGEGLAVLGASIGHIQSALSSVHTYIINRIYEICVPLWLAGERAMLPPPPPELQEMPIRIELIGSLAQIQKMSAVASIERLLGIVSNPNIAAAFPGITDKIDGPQTVDDLADRMSVPGKMIRSDEDLAAMAEAKAKQQQMQEMQAGAPAMKQMASALKDLGDAQVGGGKGALQNILENAGLQPEAEAAPAAPPPRASTKR